MRLLIDACLPQRFRHEFPDHETLSASYLGWDGLSNGELLAAMMRERFGVLLTADANLPHQQSVSVSTVSVSTVSVSTVSVSTVSVSTVCVIVLRAATNRLRELKPLTPRIRQALAQVRPGLTIEVTA